MITHIKNKKFLNRETLGLYVPISFDTYVELPGGKENIDHIEARIHYFEAGSGKPLLLLHGVVQSLYAWRHNIEELAQHYRVIVPDLIGHGFSQCPPMDYTIEQYTLFIENFLKALDIPSAYIAAFGQSAGYALDFACYHGEMTDALILINPGAFADTSFPSAKAIRGGLGASAMSKYQRPSFVAKCMDKAYFDKTLITDECIDEFALPLANPDVRAAIRLSILNYDENVIISEIGEIQKPVLIVSSQDDQLHNQETLEQMAMHFKNAYSFVVRNCGFFPNEEKPDKVNAAILEFLQDR